MSEYKIEYKTLEYKTLDEWYPDGKPDGRKFITTSAYGWFKPIFRDTEGMWFGEDNRGIGSSWRSNFFTEYHPPQQTKKVKMYKPILTVYDDHYTTMPDSEWHSDKNNWERNDIVGWMEIEVIVEVTE